MILSIDTHSGVPIYRQVLEQISQQILLGQLAVEEQLPSVRDLARQLKVNPMTISKVYALLDAEGLVERRRGVGLFVREINARAKIESLAAASEEVIRNAALACVQYGITEDEALERFAAFYRRYDAKHGGSRD